VESLGNKQATGPFAALGSLAARRPWVFLGAWLLLLIAAAGPSRKAPALLFGGSGDIAGSASLRADSLLNADFANPYAQMLVVTLAGVGGDSLAELTRGVEARVRALPLVGAVTTPESMLDKRLLPAPGSGAFVMAGIKAASVREAERAIPLVRAAVDSALGPRRAGNPDLRWAVTGRAALTYDLNVFNAKDTAAAELKVFPLTLIILLLAFGSLVAAGVPIFLGVVSTTGAMALVFLVARHEVLSNLVQNTVSMIGLSVGIDYSLLIVHRYREALAARLGDSGAAKADRALRGRALAECMATAGKAVFLSGLTVMIGLGGILFTPIMETRSIGWGGCIVVAVSVAATLTLLPALLIVLGSALDWPAALSQRLAGRGAGRRWRAWSHWVMARAPLCAIAGLLIIAAMAWPGRYSRFGFPEGPFIPEELEFTRGYHMLEKMKLDALVRPVNVILSAEAGDSALTLKRVDALYAFSARIRRDPAVARIVGPVDLSDKWPVEKYRMFYEDMPAAWERVPFVREAYLSRDGRRLLMQVLFKPGTPLEEQKRVARMIPTWMEIPALRLDAGGQGVYYNDFDRAMKAAYTPCIAFVLAVTLMALLLFFRSPLVAVKALVMNALSVLAGYGAVVFVFQLGHGAALFGAPGAAEVVPLTIPLMLFCVLFGLSMDYEVFLLSRIRECWHGTGDNTRAVAEGLSATGRIITSAALIMVAVFGAFAFARVVVVQMLGLGLAVAVLVDATVIRVLLVPSLMKLAGRWNWWPGGRR
jgi:RND superfamily putative drug exporter